MEAQKIIYLELLFILLWALGSIAILLSFLVEPGKEKTRTKLYPHELPDGSLTTRGLTTTGLLSKHLSVEF